jgi:hypothetical protein
MSIELLLPLRSPTVVVGRMIKCPLGALEHAIEPLGLRLTVEREAELRRFAHLLHLLCTCNSIEWTVESSAASRLAAQTT